MKIAVTDGMASRLNQGLREATNKGEGATNALSPPRTKAEGAHKAKARVLRDTFCGGHIRSSDHTMINSRATCRPSSRKNSITIILQPCALYFAPRVVSRALSQRPRAAQSVVSMFSKHTSVCFESRVRILTQRKSIGVSSIYTRQDPRHTVSRGAILPASSRISRCFQYV